MIKYKTEDGCKSVEEMVIEEVEKRMESNADTLYTFKTGDKTEFLYAFHGLDFLLTLWDMDQWLRNQVKYAVDLDTSEREGYAKARDELREIMQERNVSLEMLR